MILKLKINNLFIIKNYLLALVKKNYHKTLNKKTFLKLLTLLKSYIFLKQTNYLLLHNFPYSKTNPFNNFNKI